MYQNGTLKRPVRRLWRYLTNKPSPFQNSPYLLGRCNVCGSYTAFFCDDKALYRESLVCAECLTTSRYRSIARGILRAVRELTGVGAEAIVGLKQRVRDRRLRVYDTQVPFYYPGGAYPIPDLLAKSKWIEVQTSLYRPREPWGSALGPNTTNQNLEALTFPDNYFDVVVTSDVMEHVRLDDRAHREIRRVLKPGGVYLFTVPHFRQVRETLVRVSTPDPADPTKDQFLMEPEYHGDANSAEGGVLSYRSYGTDLDEKLGELGFRVEYSNQNFPEAGIMNAELFYCLISK